MANWMNKTIDLPQTNFQAINKSGKLFLRQQDVTDWMYDSARILRKEGFVNEANAIEQIATCILRTTLP